MTFTFLIVNTHLFIILNRSFIFKVLKHFVFNLK